MNFDDYEQLPSPSVATNMIAGAAAGVLEHCVMYPMDSIKTRMQSLSPHSTGQTLVSTFSNMIRKEGMGRPFRGVGAVVAGAGPAHALYFATYEKSKESLSNLFPQYNHFNYLISAVTATLIHDAVSNPTEVIKQRLQMYDSPYRTIVQCMRGVYKTEGLGAFYRSYATQLCMNLPHQTLHFTTYEFLQNKLNRDRRYNPSVHVIAGGAAGAIASACTTPLDVVKTLLNTQETGIGLTRGMKEAIIQIHQMAGPLGFFKGMQARVLYSMPATAICWSTYEFFKFILSQQKREDYRSTVSGSYDSPDHSKTADKKRAQPQEDALKTKRYVIAPEIIAEGSNLHHSVNTSTNTPTPATISESTATAASALLPIARELTSIPGTGAYRTLSLKTMHSDHLYDPMGRGCNR